MDAQCPHCGVPLPAGTGSICPACGQALDSALITSQAIIPPENVARKSRTRGSVDREEAPADEIEYLEQRIAQLEWRLHQSSLQSDKFLTRAFAVWGHFIVAHLIILLPIILFAMCAGLLGRSIR